MLSVLLTHDRNKNMAHQRDLKPDDEVDEENTAFSVDGRKNVDNCDGGTMGIDNSDGGTLMDGEVEEHRHSIEHRNCRSQLEQQPSIEEAPKFDVKWWEELKDMMLSVLLTHDRNKNMAHQRDLKPDDEVDEENTAFSVDGRKNVDNCDGGTMGIDNSDGGTLMDGEVATVDYQRGTNSGLLITNVDAPNKGLAGGADRRREEEGGAIILECGGTKKSNDATILEGNEHHAAAVVVNGRLPWEVWCLMKMGIG